MRTVRVEWRKGYATGLALSQYRNEIRRGGFSAAKEDDSCAAIWSLEPACLRHDFARRLQPKPNTSSNGANPAAQDLGPASQPDTETAQNTVGTVMSRQCPARCPLQRRLSSQDIALENMFEVQAGQVAAMQSQSPDIKEYARQMVDTHTQSLNRAEAADCKDRARLQTADAARPVASGTAGRSSGRE